MITVTKMTPAHLPQIHAIECHSFSDPWQIDDILFEMQQDRAVSLVALLNDKVVGYVTMRHLVNEGHIGNIAVHEDYRKSGIGSALIEGLIREAEAQEMVGMTLEVRVGNRAAMALYHKYGFKVEGYRRGFYRDPKEDAAIMWKVI